jgi:hypothetical protein
MGIKTNAKPRVQVQKEWSMPPQAEFLSVLRGKARSGPLVELEVKKWPAASTNETKRG